MADMFGRETVLGGVMSSEATKVTFTGDLASPQAGLIMQQLNIQYSQNITRLYALEDSKVYFVAGRTDGNITIQHVIGPAGIQKEFIEKYSDVCAIDKRVFRLELVVGCGDSKTEASASPAVVILKNPVITAINLQMQSQNMIIGSGLTGMFVSLEIDKGGGNPDLLKPVDTRD